MGRKGRKKEKHIVVSIVIFKGRFLRSLGLGTTCHYDYKKKSEIRYSADALTFDIVDARLTLKHQTKGFQTEIDVTRKLEIKLLKIVTIFIRPWEEC